VVEFTFVSQEGTSSLLSINLANIFRFFVFFHFEFGNKFATKYLYLAQHTLNVLLQLRMLIFFISAGTINAKLQLFLPFGDELDLMRSLH